MQTTPNSLDLQNGIGNALKTDVIKRLPQLPAAALPDVFVVGAAKAGTTALYHYFKQHSQVFVPPVKETNFMAFYDGYLPAAGPGDYHMARKSVTNLADYQAMYSERTIETVAADISPAYMYYPHAAEKIAELCPQAKIVIILRNPIECAFSMFSMLCRDRREPCHNFLEAFRRSGERVASGWEWAWDHQRAYLFAAQVKRYLDLFPSSQLFIRRYESLQHAPRHFYAELCEFLGVAEIDIDQGNRRVNAACTKRDLIRTGRMGRWALRAAHVAGLCLPNLVKEPLRKKYLSPPAFKLSAEDRRMLVNHFGADILELSTLLDWDLSSWVKA